MFPASKRIDYVDGPSTATNKSMFAIIQTGGKQYLVQEGQELKVEKLEKSDGESIELEALLVSDDEGANTKIGAPTVAGGNRKRKKSDGCKIQAKVTIPSKEWTSSTFHKD